MFFFLELLTKVVSNGYIEKQKAFGGLQSTSIVKATWHYATQCWLGPICTDINFNTNLLLLLCNQDPACYHYSMGCVTPRGLDYTGRL